MEAALVFAAADGKYGGDARKVAELLSQGGRVDAREQGFPPMVRVQKKNTGLFGNFSQHGGGGSSQFPKLKTKKKCP